MDEEGPNAAALPQQYIETVDEEELPGDSARRLSKNHKSLTRFAVGTIALSVLIRSLGFRDAERLMMACHAALFYAGFALLPWLWFSNTWLFWPHMWSGGEAHIRQYARRSAIGFIVASAIVLPWTLTFMIGGAGVVGQRLFDKMNLAGVDLSAFGLAI